MTTTAAPLVLASYTNDSGDRMEWVLRDVGHPDLSLLRAFLKDRYPRGGVAVGAVATESMADFAAAFDGEFEAFRQARQRR